MPSRRAVLALPLLATLGLAACSTGPAATTTASASATGAATADADAFPVTVKHAFGTTTVEKAPARIATVGWSDADVVLSLGVVPAGAPKITWGGNANESTDWFDAALKAQGADVTKAVTRYDDSAGVPIDAVAALQPDLILGVNSGISKDEYAKLTKIAPTVAYPGVAWGTAWEDSLRVIGKALGRSSAADRLLTATNKRIDDGLAEHPELKGKTAAWAWFTPTDLSTIGLYTSSDLRPQMLRRFGLQDASIVTTLSRGTTQFSANLSAEKSTSLDADVLVFYVEKAGELATLKANPLLGQIPALKGGTYVASADNAIALSMSSPSPLSLPVAVDKFLPKLASAAQGTPAS